MNRKQRLFYAWIVHGLSVFVAASLLAQEKNQTADPIQTPIDIQFTNQMSRSQKDFLWSQSYLSSYESTSEIPYLKLAAEFCLKAIYRLADTQQKLSRTTSFFNLADQKRLQACQFYEKIQRQSFLLKEHHHLSGAGDVCK